MIRFSDARQTFNLEKAFETQPDNYVLIGDVVTMDDVLTVHRRGAVGIAGNSILFVVGSEAQIPVASATWTRVDTQGTIFPGMIDLHNHLPYNMLPFWAVDQSYEIRNEWQNRHPEYDLNVKRPFEILAKNSDKDYPRAMARYAECRSLFGGVTTGQGISAKNASADPIAYAGLMRNIEFPEDASWPAAFGQTGDLKPAEILTTLVPALEKKTPYLYHLCEGKNAVARQHFLDLKVSSDTWAVNRWLIGVHCVGLEAEDLEVFKLAGGVVWSPTSNLLLYGVTAKIEEIKKRNIPISLGVDWSPSGCKNILGELKVAWAISQQHSNIFSPADLVAMCTSTPAAMIDWQNKVGKVIEGLRADLLVIEGIHADPYLALIEAKETDIRAVLVDGIPRLAKADPWAIAQPESTELYHIGGVPYFIDVPASQGIWQGMTLSTAVAKLTYGLEHLAEVEGITKSLHYQWHISGLSNSNDWWIEDEFSPAPPSELFALSPGNPPSIPPIPLKLPPLAAVDDSEFGTKFAANPNLPEYLKNLFRSPS
jgi:5-methylthioadenosine/S-adenosylhomocysteine deaminase